MLHDENIAPDLEEDKYRRGLLGWILHITQLDTCFWVKKDVQGPAPGEQPKVIALHATSKLKSDPTLSRQVSQLSSQEDSRKVSSISRVSNAVTTSKYTIWDFLVRATLIQFKRFANAFYLVMALIAVIGQNVTIDDQELFLVPFDPSGVISLLTVVVAFTLIFEALSDYRRHQADARTNCRKVVKVLNNGDLVVSKWEFLKPGDIVKIHNREEIPADLLILKSDLDGGICYIETSGIDGETNLKIKEAPKLFQAFEGYMAGDAAGDASPPVSPKASSVKSAEPQPEFVRLESAINPSKQMLNKNIVDCSRGVYEYEEPNAFLQFGGRLIPEYNDDFCKAIGASPDVEQGISLGFTNIVLRGSELRNTSWILGMVMYAGMETKLVLSKQATPQKFSLLDRFVNSMIHYVFVGYLLLLIFGSLLLVFVYQENESTQTQTKWYFKNEDLVDDFALPPTLAYIFTFSILFSGFIPISIYVALEVAMFVQAYFLSKDKDMYHEESETYAECRTNNLISDIGQVTHIVSDKTGTLTNNVMRLVGVHIFDTNKNYGLCTQNNSSVEIVVDQEKALEWEADGEKKEFTYSQDFNKSFEENGEPSVKSIMQKEEEMIQNFEEEKKRSVSPFTKVKNALREYYTKGETSKMTQIEAERLVEWLELVCLCHSVLIDYDEDGEIRYNAEGPDEEALILGSKEMGITLMSSGQSLLTFRNDYTQEETSYQVLALNPFNSKRKRMSVVVEKVSKNKSEYLLLMKGADNMMFNLAREHQGLEAVRQKQLEKQVLHYAWNGLRVLVMGKRKLSSSDYLQWKKDFDEAAAVPGDDRVIALEKVADEIEKDVEIVGASAIEDELQNGVPDTISTLRDANIKLWVATGDKVETAINIALSAKLLDNEMLQVQLISKDQQSLLSQIDEALTLIERTIEGGQAQGNKGEKLTAFGSTFNTKTFQSDTIALIVSGEALEQLLLKQKGSVETQRKFAELANYCKVVLACRVSPKQKALIVKMIVNPLPDPEMNNKSFLANLKEGNFSMILNAMKGGEPKSVVLSIGDGANDVPMIQEAAIGVGISGKEGRQAVNNSDFSIAQFKFLKELLLIHGTWNYCRNTKLVKYVTYTWIVLTVTMFMFQFHCLFSGQLVLVNIYYQTLFGYVTNTGMVLSATTDRYVEKQTLLYNPWTYLIGQKCFHLNASESIINFVRSILHGVIVFYLTLLLFDAGGLSGLENLGAAMYSGVIMVLFQRQFALTTSFTIFHVFGSILLMIMFIGGMYVLDSPPFLFLIFSNEEQAVSDHFAVSVFVLTVIGLGEMMIRYIWLQFLPTSFDVLAEMDRGYPHENVDRNAMDNLKHGLETALLPLKIPGKELIKVWERMRNNHSFNDSRRRSNLSALPNKFKPTFMFDFPFFRKQESRSLSRLNVTKGKVEETEDLEKKSPKTPLEQDQDSEEALVHANSHRRLDGVMRN